MVMDKLTAELYSFLNTTGKVLAVSHQSPDGDAIGSLLAFGGILEQYEIDYVLAIDDSCPSKYDFIPGYDKIRNLKSDPLTTIFPKLAGLDASSISRIGSAQACIDSNTRILNIDHHFASDFYGHINIVDTEICATAAIIYDLCQKLEIDITPQIAYGLYVGILTDTGRFRYSNTSSKALNICGSLVSKGVNPSLVTERLFFNTSADALSSLSWSLSNMLLYCDGLVSIISLDREHFVKDSENFVDFGLSIEGVVLGAFITEIEENHYKISLRSRCSIDVSDIARRLGGGGHQKASGCTYKGTLEETRARVIDEFTLELQKTGLTPRELLSQQYQKINAVYS